MILEMKADEVQKECLKYGLPVVDKQIHNIQRLVSFFNTEDKKLKTINSMFKTPPIEPAVKQEPELTTDAERPM